MDIQAAVIREPGGPFQIERAILQEPRADEGLVRIVGAGVCHTDMVCRDQYFPVPLPCVFGHEGAGVVERVGASVTKVAAGDHVVLTFSSCRLCANCIAGMPAYCTDLYQHNFLGSRPDGSIALSAGAGNTTLHGHFFAQSSFSTFALSRERNTVKVRRDVPLWLLGPLGCGVQTGAGAFMNSLRPQAGTNVAVFGAGTVGLPSWGLCCADVHAS
jgi:aryl-alcohol dehydrogenase